MVNGNRMDMSEPPVKRILDEYRLSLEAANRSRKTISWYLDILGRYFTFLRVNNLVKPINQMGRQELRAYIRHLQVASRWDNRKHIKEENKGKLSPFSVQGHVRAIKAFWSWLLDEGYVESNTMAKFPLPKVPWELPKILTVEQLKKLIAELDRTTAKGMRQYCIVLLLLDTGVRISEMVNMKLADLDLNHGSIRVTGKGQKERFVPISRETRKQLRRYLGSYYTGLCPAGSSYLFPDSSGEPITVNGVQQFFRRLARKAGLTGVRCSPHVFRHTFATMSVAGGADILILQEIMGHKDP